MMTIQKVLDEIYSCKSIPKKNLDNIHFILKKLGNPEKNLKIIHVAGTNGKGSVVSMLEAILLEAGYSVGKYTSPHISNFHERIVFNRELISSRDIIFYYGNIKQIIDEYELYLNFFEITTIIMFCYFSDKKADYAVVETGLGGRLDATNAADSIVSVITNISFDHIDILGNTLEQIAFEKTGIIKNRELCIFASRPDGPELSNAVKSKTDNYINVFEKYTGTTVSLNKEKLSTLTVIDDITFEIPLFGAFQADNFLLVYEVSLFLGIKPSIIKTGLSKTIINGRFQLLSHKPLIILDVAHNADSVNVLKNNLLNLFSKDEIVVITSALKTKAVDEMLDIIKDFSDNIILTSLDEAPKGFNIDELAILAEKILKEQLVYADQDIVDCFDFAKSLNKKAIVICGSFYLADKFIKNWEKIRY